MNKYDSWSTESIKGFIILMKESIERCSNIPGPDGEKNSTVIAYEKKLNLACEALLRRESADVEPQCAYPDETWKSGS